MIETALFIVGTGICIVVILTVIGFVLGAIRILGEVAWDVINPNGPIRGKREDSSNDSR